MLHLSCSYVFVVDEEPKDGVCGTVPATWECWKRFKERELAVFAIHSSWSALLLVVVPTDKLWRWYKLCTSEKRLHEEQEQACARRDVFKSDRMMQRPTHHGA